MSKWQRILKAGLAASAVGGLVLAADATPGHAEFLSGLQNWLGGDAQNSNIQQTGSRRGFFFWRNRDEEIAPRAPTGPNQAQTDPFKAQWVTNPRPGYPTLLAQNIQMTQQTIYRYQEIVAQGGWPRVPELAMRPGSTGQEVVILHRRLEVSGDLVGRSVPDEYDEAVVRAVQKFQARHGLPPTGVIDRNTIDAMNVPADVRLRQLQSSLSRMQDLVPKANGRYVIVNIPAAQAEAVDHDQVVERHTVVVGKVDHATPTLESKITNVSFNPYWHVPRSIVNNELVKKARELSQEGVNFLDAYHMQAINASGQVVDKNAINWFSDEPFKYNYRQVPWAENSLGFVKINFANKYAVYMHDTPEKNIFTQDDRYESHGCVRVHDVDQLVAWLLQDNPGWNLPRVDSFKQSGEQMDVTLRKPVPVMFVYISAWTTPDGVVHMLPDIYNMDSGTPETASALSTY